MSVTGFFEGRLLEGRGSVFAPLAGFSTTVACFGTLVLQLDLDLQLLVSDLVA